MKTFTITTTIGLPDDEFDYAELVAKCRPLPGVIFDWMNEHKIDGTVTHSFDGRKARAPKVVAVTDTGAGSYQPPANGASAGAG